MNTAMWENQATQGHLETLCARGARILNPESGALACGEEGTGKLPAPEKIVQTILTGLEKLSRAEVKTQDLKNVQVLMTAGPTRSFIDAVRYMTNPSSGKMGAALAEAALARGAEVFYVLGMDRGVVAPAPHPRLHLITVETAEEMLEASLKFLPRAEVVIATAAVLDYRVAETSREKIKRSQEPVALTLLPSVDVLGTLREKAKKNQIFFGFAAETVSPPQDSPGFWKTLEDFGRIKLEKKKLSAVFANAVARAGETLSTGFAGPNNAGVLVRRDHASIRFELSSKKELAQSLWDTWIAEELRSISGLSKSSVSPEDRSEPIGWTSPDTCAPPL
jgi:phosphopantothenoylcysteine decarboxylase/phosphopantothenate--cysteine ligase